MARIEAKPVNNSLLSEMQSTNVPVLRRQAARWLGSRILPSEVVRESERNGLSEFEHKIEEGYGGIVIFRHFSLRDPFQVVQDVIFSSPVLKERKVLFPKAEHQVYPGLSQLGRFFGIEIAPIVTGNTVEHAREKSRLEPRLNGGLSQFKSKAVDLLRKGGIVAIAPEGERRKTLAPYEKHAIGLLLLALERARVENVVLTCIDLRLASKNGCRTKRGLNLFNQYQVRVGQAFTMQDILKTAEVIGVKAFRMVDEIIFAEMQRTAQLPKPNQA